ncbi:MAG: sigma 54-interacting transcriptional regulator [Deltaproteobacteria bacterium]|nr:sigma 54-interacting transcriptional regulator [Deltaproteobacteria bacterium]
MTRKLTYEELEQRVRELENKIDELRLSEKAIKKTESRLKEAEQIAKIGHWELDLSSDTLYWSDEIYRIFEIDPEEFEATYQAFLKIIHPEDRKLVDKAFTDSLKNKTGYDIVHRLLLKDGSVKYVHEKCQTTYDDHENPLRSIGTVQDITRRKLSEHNFSGIIGKSAGMQEVFSSIRECAEINIPVYIQGESGTGKELVAMAIHNQSSRANKPFVPVNCSALPEGLLESELFGHIKGSFTGAVKDRKGRFELARGGTLFLDEVADLSKPVQGKLLRVLQEGTFEPVGEEKTISADVRIISAANRNLKNEVKKGNFRDDLYYRINVVPIYLPSLRERKEDIPLLIDDFLHKSSFEGQSSQGVSKDALAVIIDYAWPGNIRELQSTISYAIIKSKGKMIQPEHLPPELRQHKKEHSQRGPSRKLNEKTVRDALVRTGGNKAKAARYLGVGRATLYRFLEDFPEACKNI